MKRKLLPILLALVTIFSLLPTAALAEETLPAKETVVAMIGEKSYTDLHAALEAAGESDTVVLQSDVTLTGDWVPIANFAGTLDGNNKTIRGLSVTSTSSTTNVNSTTTSGAGLFAYLRGAVHDLTIDGAVINVPDAAQNVGVLAGRAEWNAFTNVKITNATITSKAQYVGGLIGFGYGNVTGCEVSGSTITGKDQVGGLFGYHKLINVQNNTLTNNSVAATEERAGGIFGKLQVVRGDLGEGTATLSGCTVSGGSATAPDYAGGIAGQLMGAGDGDDTDKYSITGNKVENFALNAEKEKSSFATIRDGDYKTFLGALKTKVTGNTLEDISGTLDETWKVKAEYSNFTVYERCVAKIGNVKYTTLNAAITAAQDGETVNIIADCTIEAVEIDNDITINGNGHTVTGWDVLDDSTVAIDVCGEVTFDHIKFTDFACGEDSYNDYAAIINGYSGCGITVKNCSFEKFNRQAIMFAPGSDGSMTVMDSTFDCTPTKAAFVIQKAIVIEPGEKESEVTIQNCTITGAKSTDEDWTSGGIEIFSGTVSVEGCTLTNCDEGVLVSREYFNNHGEVDYDVSSEVTLENNEISAKNSAVYIECFEGGDTEAKVTIKSGYHKGIVGIAACAKDEWSEFADAEDLENCKLTLTGGYYSAEPAAAYVAEDYYVDASNISGYPYVVKPVSERVDGSAIVIVKDETKPSISDEVTGLTADDETAITENTRVEGVTEAVAAKKNELIETAEVSAEGASKVEVDVEVEVELTAADLNADNKTMTYTATPVATVTTTNSTGGEINKVTNVAVPNSLLSGGLMTVRLPLPEGFVLEQIIHRSSGYADEYILAEGNAQGLKSFKLVEVDGVTLAVFTVTHFSTFELSGEVTYVAPVVSTYAVTVESGKNGSVTADRRSASKGSTVTLTVKPDEGYLLKSLVVFDKDGEEMKLTAKGDGKYRFTMPGGEVTVSAVFVKDHGYARGYASCLKDATCPIEPYADAVNTAWYHDGVHFCLENGLMVGLPDGSFAPAGDVTRAQVVTILWRLEGKPVVDYAMQFEDAASGEWFTEAVRWAAVNGIVEGYNDKAFGPNDAITREQFAAILYRYSQFKGYDVSVGEDTNILDFDDAQSISTYAVPAIQWACSSGVISGVSALTLDPQGITSRAQAATMFMRYCENVNE